MQPAQRTKTRPVDMEYQAAMKNNEQMLLAQFRHIQEKPAKTIKTMLYNVDETWDTCNCSFLEYNMENLTSVGHYMVITIKILSR